MKRKAPFGALRAALISALIGAAVLGAAGCSSAAPAAPAAPPSSAAATHNDADVTFVQGMIPHHTQAVAMAQLAGGRAASPGVIALAQRIEQAQGPEITQMQGFLQNWNAPTGDVGGMAGMGGMSGTAGMMTDAQMQQLDSAGGAAFDRMFLQMMTDHHTGAITMARTELRDGQNEEAKALAQKIIEAQEAEITTMQQLLAKV